MRRNRPGRKRPRFACKSKPHGDVVSSSPSGRLSSGAIISGRSRQSGSSITQHAVVCASWVLAAAYGSGQWLLGVPGVLINSRRHVHVRVPQIFAGRGAAGRAQLWLWWSVVCGARCPCRTAPGVPRARGPARGLLLCGKLRPAPLFVLKYRLQCRRALQRRHLTFLERQKPRRNTQDSQSAQGE